MQLAIRPLLARLRRRRVPVLQQMRMGECGAACLAMVLSYFGRETSISESSQVCASGRDGLTAQDIAAAARQYGLRVKAYSIEPANVQHIPLPAIAHWNFNHFVVVERWSSRQVTVVDPAVGRRRLTTAEFDAGFTGVVLTFEPGAHFERRRSQQQPSWLTFMMQLLRVADVRGLLVQIAGAMLFLQAMGLVLPVFTQVVVDQILPYQLGSTMVIFGIGLVLMVLSQTVANYLRATLLIYLRARLDTQMMLGFIEHVFALPFRFFQERTSGDLLMRLRSNTTIREILTGQILSAALDGSLVLTYLVILLVQEPSFGLLALGIGLVQIGILLATMRRTHELTQRDLAGQADSQSYLVEVLSGIATLKASGFEDRAFEHWSNLFFRQMNVSLQSNHLAAVVDTAMTTLRTLAPLLLLWMGTVQVLAGHLSLGTMLGMNALAMAFLAPLSSLMAQGQQMQLVGAHLDRLIEVLETAPEQDGQEQGSTWPGRGRIELSQVGFHYHANAPWVLRNITLAIEPGQKVALVGKTGSGKSTLAMLLLGLYSPTEGQILYNGIPLQRLDYRMLRRQYGVVLQEPFLFSGSIRQNIAFNDPTCSLDQVVDAARRAAIHEEILQMPMGYETLVAEGGSGLSGGQRQRLALARALVQKPAILLLDEATSHLDVATEALVEQNLEDLACTRIVIAHRLSTIQNADLILMLDRGTIVEQGSHRDLVARGGLYAGLIHSQLATDPAVTSA